MGKELYRNKYSTGSRRMPGWDYTRKAYYSITINTRKKGNIFGEIVDGRMILNALGKIADEYAKDISDHFSHVILHGHVIMPDHVHLLLEIYKFPKGKTEQCSVSEGDIGYKKNIDGKKDYDPKTQHSCVTGSDMVKERMNNGEGNIHMEMEHCSISPSSIGKSFPVKDYRHKPGSIPVIIRSYKSICSREIHKLRGQELFRWQTSFYDQVIFDEQYFQNTLTYIHNNPKNHYPKQNPRSSVEEQGLCS